MERQPANAPVDYGQEMDRHSRQSIATLVLGIAGLVLAFWPLLAPAALVVNAAALVLGLLLRRRTRRINIPEDRKKRRRPLVRADRARVRAADGRAARDFGAGGGKCRRGAARPRRAVAARSFFDSFPPARAERICSCFRIFTCLALRSRRSAS